MMLLIFVVMWDFCFGIIKDSLNTKFYAPSEKNYTFNYI
jgi:hypothetical protein